MELTQEEKQFLIDLLKKTQNKKLKTIEKYKNVSQKIIKQCNGTYTMAENIISKLEK